MSVTKQPSFSDIDQILRVFKGDEIQSLAKSFHRYTGLGLEIYSKTMENMHSYFSQDEMRKLKFDCTECENCTANYFSNAPLKQDVYSQVCPFGYMRYCSFLLYMKMPFGYMISEPFAVSDNPQKVCPLCKSKDAKRDDGENLRIMFRACVAYIYMFGQEYLSYHINPWAQISKFVSEGAQKKITIQDICDEVNLSRATVCKLIRKHTGMSALEFIDECKMSYAKLLLLEEYSITEISEFCQFKDPRYFSKKFKRTVGMLPSEYRKTALLEKQRGQSDNENQNDAD